MVNDLSEEKSSTFSVRQELMMAVNEASSMQARLTDYQRGGGSISPHGNSSLHDEVAELKKKLAVETSLKERAEMRELAERMEW